MRTSASWWDSPPDYGDWSNTHRFFIRWRYKGIREELLEVLIDDLDYEWLMWKSGHEPRKKRSNTKIHLTVSARYAGQSFYFTRRHSGVPAN